MFHAMNRNAVSWHYFTNCGIFCQLPVWRSRQNRLVQISCFSTTEEFFERTKIKNKLTFIPCSKTSVTLTYSNAGSLWSSFKNKFMENYIFVFLKFSLLIIKTKICNDHVSLWVVTKLKEKIRHFNNILITTWRRPVKLVEMSFLKVS